MLTTKHLEDYVLKKENGTMTVELGVNRGLRRLNEELLARPYVKLDLNDGIEDWVEDEQVGKKKLDPFLKWMIKESPEGNIEEVLDGAKFVSRRGTLSRMSQGQYLGSKGDWQVLCVRHRGVVYLQEETSYNDVRRAVADDLERATWYWGHRFESIMMRQPPDAEKSSEISLLEYLKTDIRVVMSGTLAGHAGTVKLLYSGRRHGFGQVFVRIVTHCFHSEGRLVEVKTQKLRERGPGYWFWKEKSLKWWMQSRLVGVDYLVVGNRDDEGVVRKLSKMSLTELERSPHWESSDCFNFLLKALLYLDDNLDEGGAARLSCNCGHLKVEELSPKEAPSLSEEFIDHFDL